REIHRNQWGTFSSRWSSLRETTRRQPEWAGASRSVGEDSGLDEPPTVVAGQAARPSVHEVPRRVVRSRAGGTDLPDAGTDEHPVGGFDRAARLVVAPADDAAGARASATQPGGNGHAAESRSRVDVVPDEHD